MYNVVYSTLYYLLFIFRSVLLCVICQLNLTVSLHTQLSVLCVVLGNRGRSWNALPVDTGVLLYLKI
jgi:hypothetical protein